MPQSQSSHFEQQEQNYSVASILGHTRRIVGDTGMKRNKVIFSYIRKRRWCISTRVINSDGDRKKKHNNKAGREDQKSHYSQHGVGSLHK